MRGLAEGQIRAMMLSARPTPAGETKETKMPSKPKTETKKSAPRQTLEEQIAAGGDPALMLRRAEKSLGTARYYATGKGSTNEMPAARRKAYKEQVKRFEGLVKTLRQRRGAEKAAA